MSEQKVDIKPLCAELAKRGITSVEIQYYGCIYDPSVEIEGNNLSSSEKALITEWADGVVRQQYKGHDEEVEGAITLDCSKPSADIDHSYHVQESYEKALSSDEL